MAEQTLVEGKIERKEKPKKAYIELTNEKILLKKEKGLFKKRMMNFDEIELNKILKEDKKAKITLKDLKISIDTKKGLVEFTCKDENLAKTLVNEIHRLVDEPTTMQKGKESIKTIVKTIKDNPELIKTGVEFVKEVIKVFKK